jgi:hypothetical protein
LCLLVQGCPWGYRLTSQVLQELAGVIPQLTGQNHSLAIRDLGKSDLANRFPESMVKLLIYLLQAKCPNYILHGLGEIAGKLDREKVASGLLLRLDELIAARGLD